MTHIPFIGSYLLHLLSEQGLSIDLINNNQYIGNLMFSASFGASIGRSLLELFSDKDKLLMGGDLGSNETGRPSLGGISKDKGFFMQASNTQSEKQSSSLSESREGVESSQKASYSGVSSTYPSIGIFDKLLEERNKIISETKKLILGMDSTLSSIEPQGDKKIELSESLTLMRNKNYNLLQEFIITHSKILGFPFIESEIKPLVQKLDAVSEEFCTNMNKISLNDPNYLKKTADLENKFVKRQMILGLEIEQKLFSEVKNRDKLGKYSEGFLADYKENIQKV